MIRSNQGRWTYQRGIEVFSFSKPQMDALGHGALALHPSIPSCPLSRFPFPTLHCQLYRTADLSGVGKHCVLGRDTATDWVCVCVNVCKLRAYMCGYAHICACMCMCVHKCVQVWLSICEKQEARPYLLPSEHPRGGGQLHASLVHSSEGTSCAGEKPRWQQEARDGITVL